MPYYRCPTVSKQLRFMNIYDVFVDPASDCAQADDAVLNYSMCVNKVLHMQRVFLTEHEQDDTNRSVTMPTSPPAEAREDNDESLAASSLQTMNTASNTGLSAPPAAELDEVTLPSQTAPVHQMDLSN